MWSEAFIGGGLLYFRDDANQAHPLQAGVGHVLCVLLSLRTLGNETGGSFLGRASATWRSYCGRDCDDGAMIKESDRRVLLPRSRMLLCGADSLGRCLARRRSAQRYPVEPPPAEQAPDRAQPKRPSSSSSDATQPL